MHSLNHHSSLDAWLAHLMSIHPSEIDMGLTRVTAVAKILGLTTLTNTKIVTVAGTNGKGTTCAMIEQVMAKAGWRVGVYSSPHLMKYNERVRVEGIDASDEALIEAFCAIDKARGDISLTFFEYATLAGLYVFKAAKLDLVLLEVGLGGRLDATNLIDADISVITAIDIDHQEYLGDTRELVGREKAGVFRTCRPAIVGDPNMPQSVVDYANEIEANLSAVGYGFTYQQKTSDWQFSGQSLSIDRLPLPQLPLPNAVTALAVVEQLLPTVDHDTVRASLQQARLTGRFETYSEHPLILLDVAHNPHAAAYLASRLAAHKGRRILALCGMLKDKDCQAVITTLKDCVDAWYFTDLNCDRSANAIELGSYLSGDTPSNHFGSMNQAWQALNQDMLSDDVVIVFGSFYTVAEFKNLDQE
ncbi:bifunctional folylpolyglutamate synthase/dihydrofolate synthase [Shewanella colwelliana]|uniref:Dihydrofolate synthase/folylpolyglutamate synthase n=1 Tax=Shewanella colwelliana TaxID=23 RepID=A0ABQ4NY25_SHECO|nr:bifunctional tetrahydrofolate synthase/dihydrofolate synthase [Shewanella colwelliana]GIU39719.1 bifunctional folylpolyglutamate synthase/dihydrofolate synthase [Shewanella colwelliana]